MVQEILESNNLLVHNSIYRFTFQNNSLDKIRVQLGA